MTLEIQPITIRKELEFPMMLKKMTDDEIRAYHRKKLYELSLKMSKIRIEYPDGRVYDENGKLIAEYPNYEQKEWIKRKLTGPAGFPKVHENKIGDSENWK